MFYILFLEMIAENPWFVDSIHDFWYLKCPECAYDSKEETDFQLHATENHPLSSVLFTDSSELTPG